MSRRIGLFGGTFNPVHIGHLVVAQDILNKLKLEKMYFIPCGTPPHKVGSDMLEAKHRRWFSWLSGTIQVSSSRMWNLKERANPIP